MRYDTPSTYRNYLADGHECMQHLSSWPAEYDARLACALARGYTIGQQGDSARGRFVYLWNEGHPGTVIEMADLTPARARIFDGIREAARGWDGSDPVRLTWPG